MTHLHPHLRGIIYAVSSYTLWVIVDALIRLVAQEHVPAYETVAVMCSVIAATIFLMERKKQPTARQALTSLWPKNIRTQLILSILGGTAQYTCVIALAHLPLNNFYVAVFTAPLTITLLAYLFLNENLSLNKLLAIITGFGGVVFALWPTETIGGDLIGYGAAVASATSYAMTVVFSRKLVQSESAMSITFFASLVQTVFTTVLLILLGGVPLTFALTLLLIFAGLINAGGNLCSYLSVTYAPAATASAYHYSQLVTGALAAYLIWHEVPSLRLLIGAAVIVASGIYIVLHTHQQMTKPLCEPGH